MAAPLPTSLPPIVPTGKGIYIRDDLAADPLRMLTLAKDIDAKWLAVHYLHPRAIRAAQAAGLDVWCFIDVSRSGPDRYELSLANAAQAARETGARGVLIDPENGWPGSTKADRDAFALHCAEVRASGLGLGITTHDGLRGYAASWAKSLGPLGCWVSPQCYSHETGDAGDLPTRPASIVAKWSDQPWPVIPSVGSWNDSGATNLDRYRAYFAALPPSWPAGALWYKNAPSVAERMVLANVWRVASGAGAVLVLAVLALAALVLLGRA